MHKKSVDTSESLKLSGLEPALNVKKKKKKDILISLGKNFFL